MMELKFRYQIDGLSLVLIDNLRVDLSCADVAMTGKVGKYAVAVLISCSSQDGQ